MLSTIGGISILAGTSLLIGGYQGSLLFLLDYLAIPEKAEKFALLFNSYSYYYLIALLLCYGLLCLVGLRFVRDFYVGVRSLYAVAVEYFQITFREFLILPSSPKLGFFIWFGALLIALTWSAFLRPLHPDEEASLRYFVTKGPLVTMAYYPGPNNHVAYNLMAWVFYFFGLPELLAMRLPSILAFSILTAIAWLWLYRRLGPWAACIGISIAVLYPHVWYYSAMGRGYGSAWWLWLVLVMLMSKPTNRFRRYLGIGLTVWGTWLVPSFLPMAACVWLAAFLTENANTSVKIACRLYVPAAIWIGVGCCFLYAPIYLFQGFDALWSNGWSNTYHALYLHGNLLAYFHTLWSYFAGSELYGSVPLYLLLLICSLGFVLMLKWPHPGIYFVTIVVSMQVYPLIMVIVLKSMPPERIFLSSGATLYTVMGTAIGYGVDSLLKTHKKGCT